MKNGLITPAMVELRAAITEAETLTGKAEMTKRDEARVNVLLAKISALRQNALADRREKRSPETERFFRALFNGDVPEQRADGQAGIAGAQTPTYTQGAAGGFLVPQEFADDLILGMAQFDPLLDEDIVTLVRSKDASLRPYRVPGWDLSTFAAAKVTESNQSYRGGLPTAASTQLNSWTYRAHLGASFELEADDFQPTLDQMELAFAIGLARGIGVDLITGDGSTGPQGVLTGATDSSITTGATGVIDATDIEKIYFKVNRWYRQSPKCAWVISDTVYQYIRTAHDTNGRPLINVLGDRETLYGKPIHVSPSVPAGNGNKGIIFGDLSHYVVRVSQPTVERVTNASGYVEKGLALYVGRQRADAAVIDPTGGSTPPIVYATLHT